MKSFSELERALRDAASDAHSARPVQSVLLGMRPSNKTWEESVPLMFSVENLEEAIECVRSHYGRIRPMHLLVGNTFPETRMYLVDSGMASQILYLGLPDSADLPDAEVGAIISALLATIEAGL